MVAIEVDEPNRLLVIHYRGRIGLSDMERSLGEAFAGAARLKPGFRLLVDLSELESMDISVAPFVEKIMDACNARGVATVVRVIPDPHRDIGLQIMSRFHYRNNVQIATCKTLAEATEILNE
jgi:anti-anti-sigma regulatory factor